MFRRYVNYKDTLIIILFHTVLSTVLSQINNDLISDQDTIFNTESVLEIIGILIFISIFISLLIKNIIYLRSNSKRFLLAVLITVFEVGLFWIIIFFCIPLIRLFFEFIILS